MPVLPFAPYCVKARMAGQIGGGEFGMIFHWQRTAITDATDAECNQFALDLSNNWSTNIAPIKTSEIKLTSVVVEGLNSATDGVGAYAATVPGTEAGIAASAQTCVLEKDVISRRYRGGHPRHYWPSLPATAMSDPTHMSAGWNAAEVSALVAFHAQAITDAQTIWGPTVQYVNISYYSGHALRIAPVIDPIAGFSVETMVATQRRRVGR